MAADSPRGGGTDLAILYTTRLDEYDRDEWRDIIRVANPNISDEAFDAAWDEFCEMKWAKTLQ